MRIASSVLLVLVLSLVGCAMEETTEGGQSEGPGGKTDDPTDSGSDAGSTVDGAAAADAGVDAGTEAAADAGTEVDALEVEATAFRVVEMTLADPHLFAYGWFDVTGQVNDMIATSSNSDASDPPDGLLDVSVVAVLRPVDSTPDATAELDVVMADCTAPVETTTCQAPAEGVSASTTATSYEDDCLAPYAGTTGGYSPGVVTPEGPCFASGEFDLTVTLGGVVLNLEYVRFGASYAGDPIDTLDSGLIAGFMTEETAAATILPDDLPAVGGSPLTSLLSSSDQDVGPEGEDGWWFYLNFTAETVSYGD